MKKLIASFMIISFFILNIHKDVYALAPGVNSYVTALKNVIDMFVSTTSPTEQETILTLNKILQSGGFISDIENVGLDGAIGQPFIKYMASQVADMQANATMQENIAAIKEAMTSGIDTSNGVSISDSFKNALVNTAKYYTDENRCYVHAYNLRDVSVQFASVNEFYKFQEYCENNFEENEPVIFVYIKPINYIGYWRLNDHPYFCVTNNQSGTISDPIKILAYDGNNNRHFDGFDRRIKFSNGEWVADGSGQYSGNNWNGTWCLLDYDSRVNFTNNSQYMFTYSQDRVGIRYFSSDRDVSVQSILEQPYYYNNQVWQDFSSSSGDYNFSPSNINTISYGDVLNYIDSFNNENGYPPSVPEINVNIDNENNNNISGGSGSGDGGSGDGGSGDGGSGDGIGDIFGWLKGLGSAIASLIKGLGEFLTEIIAGLTEALTELIGGISDLIISVTETIPTVYMEFLRACFGWMPEEWVGLFGAAVLVMVLVGIIKIIRG